MEGQPGGHFVWRDESSDRSASASAPLEQSVSSQSALQPEPAGPQAGAGPARPAGHIIWDGVEFSGASASVSTEPSLEVVRGRRWGLRHTELRCNSETPSAGEEAEAADARPEGVGCGSARRDAGQPSAGGSEDEGAAEKEEAAEEAPALAEGLLSVGSAKHEEGSCRPCVLAHTVVGCEYGTACNFCHHYHPRRRRPKISKCKRERQRRVLDTAGRRALVAGGQPANPEEQPDASSESKKADEQQEAAPVPKRPGLVSL